MGLAFLKERLSRNTWKPDTEHLVAGMVRKAFFELKLWVHVFRQIGLLLLDRRFRP